MVLAVGRASPGVLRFQDAEARAGQAGSTDLLFGAGALTILHEATSGQLRDIDRVAPNAMRLAARRKQSLVDRDLLEKVLERDQQPGALP